MSSFRIFLNLHSIIKQPNLFLNFTLLISRSLSRIQLRIISKFHDCIFQLAIISLWLFKDQTFIEVFRNLYLLTRWRILRILIRISKFSLFLCTLSKSVFKSILISCQIMDVTNFFTILILQAQILYHIWIILGEIHLRFFFNFWWLLIFRNWWWNRRVDLNVLNLGLFDSLSSLRFNAISLSNIVLLVQCSVCCRRLCSIILFNLSLSRTRFI